MQRERKSVRFTNQRGDIDLFDEDVPLIDNSKNEDDLLERDGSRLHTPSSRWLVDAILLTLGAVQMSSVMFGIGMDLGSPLLWNKTISFVFLLNLDFWRFLACFPGVSASFPHSFPYWLYCVIWIGTVLLIVGAWLAWSLHRIQPVDCPTMVRRAWLWWQLHCVTDAMTLPWVSALCGLVRPTVWTLANGNTSSASVLPDSCFSMPRQHVILVLVLGPLTVISFLVNLVWLRTHVSRQLVTRCPAQHEEYLQLKEAEFLNGIDTIWLHGRFYLFNSFRLHWAHFRFWRSADRLLLLFLLALASCTASLRYYAVVILLLVLMASLVRMVIWRPFRVRCFNYVITITQAFLCFLGVMNTFLLVPPWQKAAYVDFASFMRYPSYAYITGTCTILLAVAWFTFWVYAVVYLSRVWSLDLPSIWTAVEDDTLMYLRKALHGRIALERTQAIPAMMAPVHELSRQICVTNAYCREAEYRGDPSHPMLLGLLGEMVEAHNRLISSSIFGASKKRSVRKTAKELLQLMPAFATRLERRDQDFILCNPQSKRILLKLFAVSAFLGLASKRGTLGRDSEDVHRQFDESIRRHEPTSRLMEQRAPIDAYKARSSGAHSSDASEVFTSSLSGSVQDTIRVAENLEVWKNQPSSSQTSVV